MKTGVFFHDEFRGKQWDIIGDKFRHFPGVMEDALALPGVTLFPSRLAEEEELLSTHTWTYLNDVRRRWYFRGASLTVGGAVDAAFRVARGALTNALVFSVAAGHHSGPSSGWGGTYLSCSGPMIARVRKELGDLRFAILDTDAHHGDGTREVFADDTGVLHVCFCSYTGEDVTGTKFDVAVPYRTDDDTYLRGVREAFVTRVRNFKPFMIIHNLGHDTCRGDYGDRGLSMDFFPRLAAEVNRCAREVCEGRYVIITHGGSKVDVSEYIWPRIVEVLARDDQESVPRGL